MPLMPPDQAPLYYAGFHQQDTGNKSELFTDLLEIMGCKQVSLPFKYLGVLLGEDKLKVDDWEPILNKFDSKLGLLDSKCLVIGGRVILIRVVLSSLPLYMMVFTKLKKRID
jgi:hypothetical protein